MSATTGADNGMIAIGDRNNTTRSRYCALLRVKRELSFCILIDIASFISKWESTVVVFKPSSHAIFDEILKLCALNRSTITFICDQLTTPDYISLDTVHRQVARLDRHTVVDTSNTRLSEIAAHARRIRLIPKKKVDLAIDCTDLPYHGNPNTPGVVGGKPKKSTNWFFRFATICIVEKEYRFPLGVIPVDQFRMTDLTGVVTELLEMASRHVSVNVLLLDRGFHSVKVFRKLKELGVRWLMPATNTRRVKEGMKEVVETARQGGPKSKRIVLSGQGGESQVTLIVKWSKKNPKKYAEALYNHIQEAIENLHP